MTLLWARTKGRRSSKGRKFNPPPWRPRRGGLAWRPPPLSIAQILAWADEYHERTGSWPKKNTGRIAGTLGEDWARVDRALRRGLRGLQGRSSLPQLLSERRGVRNHSKLPRLTERQILAWADKHHKRTRKWPRLVSGPIEGAPGESWLRVDLALRNGGRGLARGSSRARLLKERRRVRLGDFGS